MKKILSLLGSMAVVVGGTSGTLAVLQTQNIQVPQLPSQPQKTKLNTVLTKVQLGILENGNAEEILALAKFNNPGLETKEVETTKINDNLAVITPLKESRVYEQSFIGVQVTFEVKQKEKLADVIHQKDLGTIVDETPESILNGLKKVNPNLKIEDVDVRLNTITEHSAVIQAKLNGSYKNEVLVTYTLAMKKLSKDLIQTELGFLANNDKNTIFNALIKKNPNLITTEISLQKITLTSSYVVVNKNSVIYDQNEILISFEVSPYSLKDDLTIENLGEIRSNSISEISKILETKTKVQINEVQIFAVTGFSFKIQARAGSHYYRVEDPIDVKFSLPTKFDLQMSIKDFNWIDHRNAKEIIQDLEKLINTAAAKNGSIKYGKDFTIDGLDKLKENKEDHKNLTNKTLLVVKAKIDSEYLTGQINCNVLPKVDLTKYNDNKETVKVDEPIIPSLIAKIKNELGGETLKENIDETLQTLKINESERYRFKHLKKEYYHKISFKIKESPFFINNITWNNLSAPVYTTNEIILEVDKTPMLSFVDEGNDRNYPDYNPNNSSSKYYNQNHHPTPGHWETTSPIVFGEIHYQRDFNLSLDAFFATYEIRLDYLYALNGYCDWYHDQWWNTKGKKMPLESASKMFNSKGQVSVPKTNSSGEVKNADGYDRFIGEFEGGYRISGALQIYMNINSADKIIEIGGVAASWYGINQGGVWRAAFARLRAESLQVILK